MNALYGTSATLRNADLGQMVDILKDQRARTLDVVAPASQLHFQDGQLVVAGSEPVLTDEGVDQADGRYDVSEIAEEGVSSKLEISRQYMRRMRTVDLPLLDHNVNTWLRAAPARKFLVRLLQGEVRPGDTTNGLVRAFLSDSFRIVDNFDVLMSTLAGIRDAGVTVVVDGADLSERRMSVRLFSPDVQALAPTLLAGYRSPFDAGAERAGGPGGWNIDNARAVAAQEGLGYAPGTEPIVWAGFKVENSETGGGAFSITPQIKVKICRNGLTITTDVVRQVHLGGRMESGVVRWSEDTQRKNLDLIKARARDAVSTFLNPEYLAAKVAELEKVAGTPVVNAPETIRKVAKKLLFSDAESDLILSHFVMGGQLTAGGVAQAVSSAAQTISAPAAANELESKAVPAMYAANELVAVR